MLFCGGVALGACAVQGYHWYLDRNALIGRVEIAEKQPQAQVDEERALVAGKEKVKSDGAKIAGAVARSNLSDVRVPDDLALMLDARQQVQARRATPVSNRPVP